MSLIWPLERDGTFLLNTELKSKAERHRRRAGFSNHRAVRPNMEGKFLVAENCS